ncbi:hypothetical protein [Helicobacter labacensis]|uniref:hypothetical protein n=1 Tax=Helicobacter labacensis TaxID=2316079 RepID=UPI000EB47B48|nr:hypothetical protein [Helicobacter labacensis]
MHKTLTRALLALLLLAFVLGIWLITRTPASPPQSPKWSLDKGVFLNASQELYHSMLGAFQETTKGMLCPKGFDPDIYSVDMVKKHAPTWINLASKMVDALPTIKAIQAELPPPLAQEIRSFEVLHVIALMRYKLPNMNCYEDPSFYTMIGDPQIQPLHTETFLENFSTSLEVVYPLLIQAFKQSLDLKEYLRFLGEKSDMPAFLNDLDAYLEKNKVDAPQKGTFIAHLQALQFSTRAYLFIAENWWWYGSTDTYWSLGEYERDSYYSEINQPLGLSLSTMRSLSHAYLFAIHARLEGITEVNWEMSPMLEYSLPKMVQDFFHNFRFIAFKQPCLYLTPQNTIQTFPSKEPLCQILKDNPPNVSAPLPKGLVQAFQNAQDFLIQAFNAHNNYGEKKITFAQIKPALSQHLQAIIQATPLLAPLKGKEWDHLLDYTQSQLLTLLQAYMRKANETSNDLHRIIRPATFIAQDYLHMLDLIYPSLLQAKKQGLDLSLYLKALQVSKPLQARPCKNPCNPIPDIASRGYPQDLRGMGLAQKLALHQRIVPKPCNRNSADYCIEWDDLQWDLASQWLKSMDTHTQEVFQLWDLHAQRRVEAFLYNQEFYIDSIRRPELISGERLRANPTPCFAPQYLSAQSVQNCQHIFKAQSFNPLYFKDYIRSVRLLSIGNSPCLYLNAQEQLSGFDSKEPACLALQDWALYTPPKELTLPAVFLQNLDSMHTQIRHALQNAPCRQDHTSFLKPLLSSLEQQAQNALESLPLFAHFKTKLEKYDKYSDGTNLKQVREGEAIVLKKHMQTQAIVFLFALLEGNSSPCQQNPLSTQEIAQNLVRVLDFLYKPLRYQPLLSVYDASEYVSFLAHRATDRPQAQWAHILAPLIDPHKFEENSYNGKRAYALYQDYKIALLTYQMVRKIPTKLLSWDLATAFKESNSLGCQVRETDPLDLSSASLARFLKQPSPSGDLRFSDLKFFALQRIAQFLEGLEVVLMDQNAEDSVFYLPKHPSACLHPEYLRSSTQAQCVAMFAKQNYDVATLKTYLDRYRMISIRGTPCVVLSLWQVRPLSSLDSLCRSLSKPTSQRNWFKENEGR